MQLKLNFITNENSVFKYSPSCCYKPVRPSFLFGTQTKIFLMKPKSYLTLHKQQRNYHIQGPGSKVVNTSFELLNKVIIFVFFDHTKYSRSFITLR